MTSNVVEECSCQKADDAGLEDFLCPACAMLMVHERDRLRADKENLITFLEGHTGAPREEIEEGLKDNMTPTGYRWGEQYKKTVALENALKDLSSRFIPLNHLIEDLAQKDPETPTVSFIREHIASTVLDKTIEEERARMEGMDEGAKVVGNLVTTYLEIIAKRVRNPQGIGLKDFLANKLAAERQACALLCLDYADSRKKSMWKSPEQKRIAYDRAEGAEHCADRIRSIRSSAVKFAENFGLPWPDPEEEA